MTTCTSPAPTRIARPYKSYEAPDLFITLSKGLLLIEHVLEQWPCGVCKETRISRADHQTNNPGALKVKACEKLVSTILAASTTCQESRLDTTSGKGYCAPNVRADGFGATRFRLGPLPGNCMDRGMLDLFCKEKALCTVQSYWSEQFIVGNKTEKSPDEPPTDQEHRSEIELTKHTVSSRPRGAYILAALSLVKSIFVFVRCSSAKLYSKVVYSYHSITTVSVVVCAVDRICSNDICL